MAIVGLDARQKLVIVSDIDQNLSIVLDAREEKRKRPRSQIRCVFRFLCCCHYVVLFEIA